MEEHNNRSVLIAMSGGVDSSAAAYLMQAGGFRCQGATMRLLESDDGRNAADAESVCRRLGIPFMTLDMAREFREDVIEKFVRVYRAGGTPNPCVDCNRRMKFSRLMEAADGAGLHYVATGHYARVGRDAGTGRQLLKKALDAGKDQSYFLYTLTQSQLSRVQFPLGGMEKRQVRELAERLGFVNARRRDSQDICFIPGGDYGAFIESWTGEAFPAGDFLDREGRGAAPGSDPLHPGPAEGAGPFYGRARLCLRKGHVRQHRHRRAGKRPLRPGDPGGGAELDCHRGFGFSPARGSQNPLPPSGTGGGNFPGVRRAGPRCV